jgi:carbon-monoxide dehydrogenase medium subunit
VSAFAYERPTSMAEAWRLLASVGPTAKLLAGGTDLLVHYRLGRVRPALVVDLKHVRDLPAGVSVSEGTLQIGARAVMTEVLRDLQVRRFFPALADAARVVGSIQIRNRATVAGNLCNASPAADTAAVLLAHDAHVRLAGPRGSRRVPLTGFFTGPGRTVLAHDEIMETIELPLPLEPTGAAFGRVTRRRGVDLATVNMCCLVTASGQVRVAFGAVAPRPFLASVPPPTSDGRDVHGRRLAALQQAIAEAAPISDLRGGRDYRLAMLDVIGRRTMAAAAERLDDAVQRGPA